MLAMAMELPNWLWTFFTLVLSSHGLYSLPYQYRHGDSLPLKVNSLTSYASASSLSYRSFLFCSQGRAENSALNLGQLIMGDRIQTSPYELKMNTNVSFSILCRTSPLSASEARGIRRLIDENYHVNFLVDDLPAKRAEVQDDESPLTWTGLPVGIKVMDKYHVYNHLKFKILTKAQADFFTVVGFEVVTMTVTEEIQAEETIEFSYEVSFEQRDADWDSRWDAYIRKETPRALWLSILTPSIVGVFLSCWILVHCRRREVDDDADVWWRSESSHTTSFLPPSCPMLLCVAFGSGAQILGMACLTLLLACVGRGSTSSRGTFLANMAYCFVVSSVAGGYAAVRLRRVIFAGSQPGWVAVALRVAFFFPATAITILSFVSSINGSNSNTAILFSILVLLWTCVGVPLTLLGGYWGSKGRHARHSYFPSGAAFETTSHEVWQACLGVLLLGCLPFKAIEYDLRYTVECFWKERYFVAFDTHLVILLILLAACAEASITCNLERLHDDRLWWWKAFFGSGSCGVYVFCYLIEYPVLHLQPLNPSSAIVVGYSALIGMAVVLAAGAVGLLSTFLFLNFASTRTRSERPLHHLHLRKSGWDAVQV